MRIGNFVRPLMAGLLMAASATVAAQPAAAPTLAAVGQIEPGQWQLREVGGAARSMCVSDPDSLFQIEHMGAQCSRFVVDDQPRSATVHYTCPGAGNGRTSIKIETRNSFHLDTQGILNGAPFDTAFDARRTGACGVAVR